MSSLTTQKQKKERLRTKTSFGIRNFYGFKMFFLGERKIRKMFIAVSGAIFVRLTFFQSWQFYDLVTFFGMLSENVILSLKGCVKWPTQRFRGSSWVTLIESHWQMCLFGLSIVINLY